MPAPPRRGVSLIEALVALLVMSFGMLALLGVQVTLRYNTDVSRQGGDAMHLAAEDMESLRLFTDVVPVNGQAHPSWSELASAANADVQLPDATGNATYGLTRTVNTVVDRVAGEARFDTSSQKVVVVQVAWTDRTNVAREVRLEGVVSGVAPVLSGALAVPPSTSAPSRRNGRNTTIPVEARDLGDGRSAYKPFDQGTTVWLLNNATGYVTSVCSGAVASQTAITAGDLANCTTVDGRLVTGVVRFHLLSTVDAAAAESPQSAALPLDASAPLAFYDDGGSNQPVNQSRAPLCVSNSPDNPTASPTPGSVNYACIVFPADGTGWGGKLNLVAAAHYANGAAGWSIGAGTGQLKVCRYTTASSPFTSNANHPQTYCRVASGVCTERVRGNLQNQNFLVIASVNACPTDVAANPAAGDLVNSNTLQHQP